MYATLTSRRGTVIKFSATAITVTAPGATKPASYHSAKDFQRTFAAPLVRQMEDEDAQRKRNQMNAAWQAHEKLQHRGGWGRTKKVA